MTNLSKNKGTAWESAVVKYCRANGFGSAERRALAGSVDRGDILLCPGIIIETKNWATYTDANIAEWQMETWKEMHASNASVGLLVVKRAGKASPGAARSFFRGEWGFWYEQPFSEGLERLRLCGWGDLV